MITLAFLLDHQVISRSDKNTVVAGSKNYVRARFILRTDDWARPITAIFGGYTQLLDDNNECTVPWEVLQQPGKVEVSAFCGDLHTANIAVVPVEKTGYKSGETPKDPTPDVYQQFLQAVKDDATAAENAAKTAQEQAQAAASSASASAESEAGAETARQEAAQSATNAAAEVGKVQSAGTSAVQAVQAAQNTATEAVSAAQQTATQTVSEAQATAVSAVQEAGTTQTSAVASAASSALSGIADAKDAALSNVAEAGEAQVSAVGTAGTSAVQGVNDAKTAALKEIEDANAALPNPTQADSGKVPTVKADGSAYELAGPYAPLSAAIRPTASGNPVSITDSVEWSLQGLKVYGKSTQDGTPSPENPVPIVSAGDGGSIGLTVSNSADQSQSLTVSTPAGLPGIPVDSGGNYTDADGQQWVCDEIDFERGEYTQNCYGVVFDGSEDETWRAQETNHGNRYFFILPIGCLDSASENVNSLNSVLKLGATGSTYSTPYVYTIIRNTFYVSLSGSETLAEFRDFLSMHPMQLLAVMTTPIVVPIPAEELAAYRALHTYDGSTVISTPEDVTGIEVRYVANGEKYIDCKISEAIASAAETKLAAYDTLSGAIHEGVNEA